MKKWREPLSRVHHEKCPREGDDARNDEITNARHLKAEAWKKGGEREEEGESLRGMPFVFTPAAFRDLTRHDRLFGGVNAAEGKNRSWPNWSSIPSRPLLHCENMEWMLGMAKRNGKIARLIHAQWIVLYRIRFERCQEIIWKDRNPFFLSSCN